MKKSQAAMELMLIAGFVTMGVLLLVYMLYSYAATTNVEVTASRAEEVARKIITTSAKVSSYGPPSRLKVEANLPEDIVGMEIWRNDQTITGCNKCTEVRFYIRTPQGRKEIASATKLEIRADINDIYHPETNKQGVLYNKYISGNADVWNYSKRVYSKYILKERLLNNK